MLTLAPGVPYGVGSAIADWFVWIDVDPLLGGLWTRVATGLQEGTAAADVDDGDYSANYTDNNDRHRQQWAGALARCIWQMKIN